MLSVEWLDETAPKDSDFRVVMCGWKNLDRAKQAVEVLNRLNPEREGDFEAVEGPCPEA